MKKIFYLIVLMFSFNSYALNDSMVISTDNNKNTVLLKENSENINNLKTKYNNLEVNLANHDTCAAKNMLYVGSSTYTDSDGCLEVQNSDMGGKPKPVFIGFFTTSSGFNGRLIRNGDTYNTANTAQSWGRARADFLCKEDYPNTRAMTLDDLKYTYSSIFGSSELSSFGDRVWLFDVDNVNDCSNYTSSSSFNSASVLRVGSYSTNNYLEVTTAPCNSTIHIACVYN